MSDAERTGWETATDAELAEQFNHQAICQAERLEFYGYRFGQAEVVLGEMRREIRRRVLARREEVEVSE